MKSKTIYIFVALIFLLAANYCFCINITDWQKTDMSYVKIKERQRLVKTTDVCWISNNCCITSNTQKSLLGNNLLYESPIWQSTDGTSKYALDNTIILYGVKDLQTIISSFSLENNIMDVDSIIGEPPIYLLQLSKMAHNTISELCKSISRSGLCQIAEQNFLRLQSSMHSLSPTPDQNPYFENQWALFSEPYPQYDVNALDAWQISSGENVKVAVLDVGFELNHPDLVNNIYSSADCTDGEDGAVNGAYGSTLNYHGTQCAGIIAAENNNIGIIGVAPNSNLILIRRAYSIIAPPNVFYPDSSIWYHSYYTWDMAAIRLAYQEHADVISCSWGDLNPNQNTTNNLEIVLSEATTRGRNGKGCVVVYSTGNDSANYIGYPASSQYTIAVGATNRTGYRPYFSNYGNGLDVVAPGYYIFTTHILSDANGPYAYAYGTSMSVPMVAGIAALMLSVNPDLTWEEVRSIIRQTAYKLPAYSFDSLHSDGSWNSEVGYGLVDAYAAVLIAKNKYIQDTIYSSGTSVLEAYPEIYAGYAVTDTKPYGNVIVQAGSNVTFKAKNRIELRPGFRVEHGATFKAIIEAPSQAPSAPSNVRKRETHPVESNNGNADVARRHIDAFSVSPNPVASILHIQTPDELSLAKIYTINGQCVMQAAQTDIDVSALPQGMYILRALTADGQQHQAKFIKQ